MSRQIFNTKVVAFRLTQTDWQEWAKTLPEGSGDAAYQQRFGGVPVIACWYVRQIGLTPTRFLNEGTEYLSVEVLA